MRQLLSVCMVMAMGVSFFNAHAYIHSSDTPPAATPATATPAPAVEETIYKNKNGEIITQERYDFELRLTDHANEMLDQVHQNDVDQKKMSTVNVIGGTLAWGLGVVGSAILIDYTGKGPRIRAYKRAENVIKAANKEIEVREAQLNLQESLSAEAQKKDCRATLAAEQKSMLKAKGKNNYWKNARKLTKAGSGQIGPNPDAIWEQHPGNLAAYPGDFVQKLMTSPEHITPEEFDAALQTARERVQSRIAEIQNDIDGRLTDNLKKAADNLRFRRNVNRYMIQWVGVIGFTFVAAIGTERVTFGVNGTNESFQESLSALLATLKQLKDPSVVPETLKEINKDILEARQREEQYKAAQEAAQKAEDATHNREGFNKTLLFEDEGPNP